MLKIKLKEKFEKDPTFILARFMLIIATDKEGRPLLSIGDYRVMLSQQGNLYLKIGVYNAKKGEEDSNVFTKKVMQNYLIDLWKLEVERVNPGTLDQILAEEVVEEESQWQT